ncbi:ABC transporter ATP-binding protein [Candidatus Poribacteria bacterium]|nr:ABC transporter ATP-binding protein [Candidatus Poribacteria bacterium]
MMIRAEELEVGYGRKAVVRNINLKLSKGQFIGLLGPNGCGKSTILKTLIRLLAPLRGAVFLDGRELERISRKELSRRVSAVLTERPSPGLLTAFDVAAMGRYPYTGLLGKIEGEHARKTWEALEMVGAADLAGRYFLELSDGEKQKVLLARALAQEPELLVLDEPTSHLDPRYKLEVMLILRRLVRENGITIVASLHEIDLAMRVCDIVILIKRGKVLAWGPPEEVLDEETVAELYDFKKACFDSLLGGIEIGGEKRGSVYVVAGSGSGARLYRTLAKHGFGISTGALPENDIDFHVAQALKATIVAEKPYRAEISPETYLKALEAMKKARQVIDAGFPVGEANYRNVELVGEALKMGKITYSLRGEEEARKLWGFLASKLIHCEGLSSLLRRLWAVECLCRRGRLW